MKHIFFVTSNLANGGAEHVTAVIANELSSKDFRVTVLYMKDQESVYPLSQNVQMQYLGGFGRTVKRVVGKILRLRKYMKENPKAVFVAMLPYETLYTFLAGIGCKCKIVYSLRNDPNQMRGKIQRFINRFVYPEANRIVFQTDQAMNFYPDAVRNKGVVIPNPISDELPEAYEGQRKHEFVTVGRLHAQKNYPMLLRAFSKVHREYPDWKLRIFGQGELKPELEQLCHQLQIGQAVEFCGFVPHVAEEIRESGCFVLASDYEGISNAMLEAMALGLPCICTDCPIGGAKMIIQSNLNGMLVPVGDEDALCKAMIRVIDHQDEAGKMGKNATAIRQRLRADLVAEEWKKILI